MLNLETKLVYNKSTIEAGNLTDRFKKDELDAIGQHCWAGWNADCVSRQKWFDRTEAAMDLAMQIDKVKTFPWPNASNVVFPLISISALNFSARAYGNLILAPDLVSYIILTGEADEETRQKALRLGRHMSFQLLEQDTAWEEQHDRLLINLAIVGTAFIKSRYSPVCRHNVGELVLARDLVVNYWTKDLASAPRITQEVEMSRNDIITYIRNGAMEDVENEDWFCTPQSPTVTEGPNQSEKDNRRGSEPTTPADEDSPFQLLEQHRNLDLDCDGYAEPYIVTLSRKDKKVLRLVAGCTREEDIELNAKKKIVSVRRAEYYTKYSFIPAPDGGFYDLGFGVLMGPLNESVNTLINQLIDAGSLQNNGGGFLGRGATIKSGETRFKLGEWKKVDATGDDLRKAIVPLATPEPSPVLFQLLGLLIEYTNLLAGSTDTLLGKNPGQNTPAETSRNMTEAGLQIYSTIFKRVWRSMKEEFRKYHVLNRFHLPSQTTFGQGKWTVRREDYLTSPDWVRPAADPNVVSAGQRLNQAIMTRESAMTSPGGYDMEVVERNLLRALRVDNLDEVFPGYAKFPPQPNPELEIEKMKASIDQQEMQLEQWKFVKEWQEAIRLNTARIQLLEAQATGIFADIEETRRGAALEAYQTFIQGLRDMNDMLDQRVKTTTEMLEKRKEKDSAGKSKSGTSDSGGNKGVVGSAAGGSSAASARQMAGGDAGPVGMGLPGGFTA